MPHEVVAEADLAAEADLVAQVDLVALEDLEVGVKEEDKIKAASSALKRGDSWPQKKQTPTGCFLWSAGWLSASSVDSASIDFLTNVKPILITLIQ